MIMRYKLFESSVEKAKKVRAMDIRDVVDNAEWQSIRKSLIGHWVNDHKHNVAILRKYFEKNKDNPLAIRRLVNVLTGSVHRTGKTAGQKETDQLRKEVRIQWKKLLGEPYNDITGKI